MSDDRTVHAEGIAAEVVRYDRAGKWYIEPKNGGKRNHVSVKDAAVFAAVACTVHFGLSGGQRFEMLVLKERGE